MPMNNRGKLLFNHTFVFLLITFVAISGAELTILEIKRGFFAGGFLQNNQLSKFSEQSLFLIVFAITNLTLIYVLFSIWNYVLRLFGVHSALIAFHFMLLVGLAAAITLTVQFQLHIYFGDALDFAVARNIAGGSLKNALLFLLDEAAIFIIAIAVGAGVYSLLHFVFRNFLKRLPNRPIRSASLSPGIASAYLLGFVGLGSFILYVNSVENVRHSINYTNAYRIIKGIYSTVSDVDFDGSSIFSFPVDPNSFNASIYPGALDIPGNGIDENGIGGDFLIQPVEKAFVPVPSKGVRRSHVVVIVLESARGDLVGKSIDGRLVAPNMTALSRQGTYIVENFSHTGYTSSSLGALFTGGITQPKPENSLFSDMKKFGYNISLFSGQDETWGNLDKTLGTRIYADHFFDAQAGVEEREFPSKLPSSIKLSEKTLWNHFNDQSRILDWSRPQFIYFNMQAAHFPYFHKNMDRVFVKEGIPRSQINPGNTPWLRKTYWNAIHYADRYVGKIIGRLKQLQVWEDTLLVVLGDHGEELFDYGKLGHGFVLSKTQTHVPLIFNQPGLLLPRPLGHADLKKIILAYAIEGRNDFRSLFPANGKFVFQFTGDLTDPSKIGFVEAGFQNLVLNLREMQVYSSLNQQWLPYETAIQDEIIANKLQKLIRHWEMLRWQDHLASR